MANFVAKTDAIIQRNEFWVNNKVYQEEWLDYQGNNSFFARFGMSDMQDSLQRITTSLLSYQALQASALVGRKVLVVSEKILLNTFGDIKIVIDIISNFEKMDVSISTKTNEIIKTFDLGKPKLGLFQFLWDGKGVDNHRLPSATYKIKVKGIKDGNESTLNPMVLANVNSVSMGKCGEGLKLNISGLGLISLDQVKRIMI